MKSSEPVSAELKAAAAAAIGSTSVGFVPLFVTGLQRVGVDTVSTLVWRYVVALAILIPLAYWRHSLAEEWKRGGIWLFLNGITLGVFQVYSYFKALETLPTSMVVTLFYCYPVLTLFIDRIIFKLPISAAKLAGVLIIVSGIALVSYRGIAGATLDPKGLFHVACSVCGYAAYIAIAYPVTKKVQPLASATFIYGAYAIAFGLVVSFRGLALPPRADLWLNVLFIGSLGGALQILSFSYALPRLASSGYAVIVCLEFVTVVLAGVFLLGEPMLTIQWLGIAMVLGGIFLARASRSMSRAVPLPDEKTPGEQKVVISEA
ncbi:MAG: DMT family transporter [Proteobacteria bacterium]|nr:DMT family transporter [Pseudomonadota bacterium]